MDGRRVSVMNRGDSLPTQKQDSMGNLLVVEECEQAASGAAFCTPVGKFASTDSDLQFKLDAMGILSVFQVCDFLDFICTNCEF